MRENEFCSEIDVCILSAEHGLIDANTEIEWYDRRMDSQRARELAPEVTNKLHNMVTNNYEQVLVNVGDVYKEAIEDGLSALDVDTYYIQGEGIGLKGSHLKQFIRGEIEFSSPQVDKITVSP